MTAAARRGAGLEEEQIASGQPQIPHDGRTPPGEDIEAEARSTYGQVFRVPEFRALWTAQVMSVAGDQLARVAITLLVFNQTRSALLASVAFAASVVPTFLGGLLLSGLADRWPRQQVMITCDLGRAVIVGVMALPWMPLAVEVGLLFLLTMVGAPFSSARAALYPDILTGDQYVLGTAVTLTTMQFAQVVGFAVGGAAVSFFGVRNSLLADAATFIASALITQLWVRPRPAARLEPDQPGSPGEPAARSGGSLRTGLRLVFSSPALLTPMLFGWLSAFYNVPEGIAGPLSHTVGGGDVAFGLILAAGAFGASVGAVAFGRLVPPRQRLRWMSRLATMGCATLILFAFRPPLPEALLVLAVSGFFDCYQLAANAAFVTAVPRRQRSQAFGIAQGGMNLGQGVAMIIAGAAAEHYPPSGVIAVTGALGVVSALSVTVLARVNGR